MNVLHLRIVLDLDGCLADFHGALVETVGPPARIDAWGMKDWYPDNPAKVKEAQAFLKDPENYQHLHLLPAAKKTMKQLSERGHKLHIVTARPKTSGMKEATEEWVHRNLRGYIDSVQVVGDGKVETKVNVIKKMAPHICVDDRADTVEALRKEGLYAVVYNQPWNKKVSPPRIFGWTHFRKVVNG